MGLFSFGKGKARSVALIDISSASVGGAYAHIEPGKLPVIYYAARVEIVRRDEETLTESMLRSLAFLGELMNAEGAPQLRRETGSGSVSEVIATISAPWQESAVTTTRIEEERPFTFTHAHLTAAAGKDTLGEDRISSGQTVIATILNGYRVEHPVGKRASRAETVMLTSNLDRQAAHAVRAALRKTFHSSHIRVEALAPVVYASFRTLYPHQEDFIVLEVSGAATCMLLVKRGLLAGISSVPQGTHDLAQAARKAGVRAHEGASLMLDESANESFAKDTQSIESAWLKGLHESFTTFSKDAALPHTVFLLAEPAAREYLKRIVEGSGSRSLWLSDNPLTVLSVIPSHFTKRVRMLGIGESDIFLSILALYADGGGPGKLENPPEEVPPAASAAPVIP